jgi:uncharacterized membrane protein YeaQ/YmgE (transglycosylase-associated protein family)
MSTLVTPEVNVPYDWAQELPYDWQKDQEFVPIFEAPPVVPEPEIAPALVTETEAVSTVYARPRILAIATALTAFAAASELTTVDQYDSAASIQRNIAIRNMFPHPVDIGNHYNNIAGSLLLGCIVGFAAQNLYRRQAEMYGPQQAKARMRTVGMVAGLTLGVIANAMTETRFGLSATVIFGGTTPDTWDLAYGAGAATLAGTYSSVVRAKPLVQ